MHKKRIYQKKFPQSCEIDRKVEKLRILFIIFIYIEARALKPSKLHLIMKSMEMKFLVLIIAIGLAEFNGFVEGMSQIN